MRETMDNFLNSLLSVSWSDMNESSDRSWVGSISSQPSSLLAGSVETFQVDEKSSIMPMVSSGHIMGNETTEDLAIAHENSSSIFSDGNLKYDIDKRLFLSGNLSQTNHNSQPSCGIETSEGGFSIPDRVTCNSSGILYDLELNSSLPHSALTISSSLGSNGSEPPTIAQSIGEAHSVSSVPTIWPSLYSGISSFCGQEKAENLVFQGTTKCTDLLRKNQNELGSNLATFVSGQQMKMAGANSPPQTQGTAEVNNNQLSSFSGGSQMLFYKTTEMHTNLQSEEITLKHQLGFSSNCPEQVTQTNSSNCNVVSKPRMRARRGQATDPHSIAERLRREKIAERMKNLQELVPNSNKTDKASMLDEIIDYVKFLQLQVKVLSMSRLGAAGAVVPLITDGQAEATGNLHLSPMSHEGEDAFFDSHGDNLGFEQEVVKLMESSVTTAMQYLQSKGLCLMPIALAAAISNPKCSATATPPLDTRKKDSSVQNNYADGVVNGLSSASVKQEETSKSLG